MLTICENSGQSPRRIAGIINKNKWDNLDRAIMEGWHNMKKQLCKCGRPLWQHEHGILGDKPEKPEDYKVYSYPCPAIESMSAAQGMWRADEQDRIEGFHKNPYGKSEPGAELVWFTMSEFEGTPNLEYPS